MINRINNTIPSFKGVYNIKRTNDPMKNMVIDGYKEMAESVGGYTKPLPEQEDILQIHVPDNFDETFEDNFNFAQAKATRISDYKSE